MTIVNAPVQLDTVGISRRILGWKFARRHPLMLIGGGMLAILICLAVGAPLIAGDPLAVDPFHRLQKPSTDLILDRKSVV